MSSSKSPPKPTVGQQALEVLEDRSSPSYSASGWADDIFLTPVGVPGWLSDVMGYADVLTRTPTSPPPPTRPNSTPHNNSLLQAPQQQAAPVPTKAQGGIDWSTFDPTKGTAATNPNGVVGQTFGVKTTGGKAATVFLADPAASQPAPIKAKITAGTLDPSTNCAGATFGTTGIVGSDLKTYNFQINDPNTLVTILKQDYTVSTVGQAETASAAGKNVALVFLDGAGDPIHIVTTTAVKTNGGKLDQKLTTAVTKNGDEPLKAGQSVNDLMVAYPTAMRVMYYIKK